MPATYEALLKEFQEYRRESTEKLEKILIQTTKTNGRVDLLMDFRENAGEDIASIKQHINETKGRDRMIAMMLGAAASIAGIVIAWLFSKLK